MGGAGTGSGGGTEEISDRNYLVWCTPHHCLWYSTWRIISAKLQTSSNFIKGAASPPGHLEKFSLNFSSLSFVIRVYLQLQPSLFLYTLIIGVCLLCHIQFRGNFVHNQKNSNTVTDLIKAVFHYAFPCLDCYLLVFISIYMTYRWLINEVALSPSIDEPFFKQSPMMKLFVPMNEWGGGGGQWRIQSLRRRHTI